MSSNIDDKTLHELYLWLVVFHKRHAPPRTDTDQRARPFQDAVRAGSGNIMCSYNRVNNSYGCANSKTLNGLLKTELGFQVRLGVLIEEGGKHWDLG